MLLLGSNMGRIRLLGEVLESTLMLGSKVVRSRVLLLVDIILLLSTTLTSFFSLLLLFESLNLSIFRYSELIIASLSLSLFYFYPAS